MGIETPARAADGPLAPAEHDPLVHGLSHAIGGPLGRHSRRGRSFWTPLRVLLALTLLTSVGGVLFKAPCRTNFDQTFQYTRFCYSDVLALYGAERLDEGALPYVDHPVEYPVVIGAVMELAAVVVDAVPGTGNPSRTFYDVTTVLLMGCALVAAATTALLAGRRRVWDAAMVALAPVLVLHLSTNWDLVAVALAGLGLVAWARRRPVVSGLLLGLAAATKLYPLLFLVPLLVLCWRAGRLRVAAVACVAAIAAIAVVYVPSYVVSPAFDSGNRVVAPSAASVLADGDLGGAIEALAPHRGSGGTNATLRFITLSQQRPADWDSLWYALQQVDGRGRALLGPLLQPLAGHPLDQGLAPDQAPSRLNGAVAGCFLALLTGIVLLGLRARRRPRLPQLLFLVVVAFLVTNKVFSPQFTLWLLPLAVLARPSWRAFLAWQITEVAVWVTRLSFFAGRISEGAGLGIGWFLWAVVLRDVALLTLAALVVRDILRPERDPVRAAGVDDPAGGVLDGAVDRWQPA